MTVEILEQIQFNSIMKTEENSTPQIMKRPQVPIVNAIAASVDVSSDEDEVVEKQQVASGKRNSGSANSRLHGSKGPLPSPLGSANSFDMQVRKLFSGLKSFLHFVPLSSGC